MTKLLKSRTVLFAVFLAVLSVAQGYLFLLPVTPVEQMFVGIVLSVIITVLRLITTKPVLEK